MLVLGLVHLIKGGERIVLLVLLLLLVVALLLVFLALARHGVAAAGDGPRRRGRVARSDDWWNCEEVLVGDDIGVCCSVLRRDVISFVWQR